MVCGISLSLMHILKNKWSMALINTILSGGVGSRLWPLSRKSRPKQYIPLFEGETLFQMCAKRNNKIVDSIQVIGNVDNYQLSRKDFDIVGIKNYTEIIEAAPRNTAASIAFAAFAAQPEDILLVTPSDHIISGDEAYKNAIESAVTLATEGYIVTFGAVPLRPETGYGYIEHDEKYHVLSFKEKPDAAAAEDYLKTGKYLWNSGMFCIKASVYIEELKQFAPQIFTTSNLAFQKAKNGFLPLEETMEIPALSVDFAIMEHSRKIRVVPFTFDWNDLGSFESIWEYMQKINPEQKIQNLVLGSEKHVEFIGLDNLILVETSDAILIMPRDKSQEVKKVYEKLERDKPELLQ